MPAKAGIQYCEDYRLIRSITEYWIIRLRG